MNGWVTHCKFGHEFTPETTYPTRSGERRCRVCYRLSYPTRNARRRAILAAQKAERGAPTLPGEKWLAVVGYEGRYEVSDLGRVRSVPGNRRQGIILSAALDSHGYEVVGLSSSTGMRRAAVHRLVCAAFNGPPGDNPLCRHLDDIRRNNIPGNLAWGTHRDNAEDARRNGRMSCGARHSEILLKRTMDGRVIPR